MIRGAYCGMTMHYDPECDAMSLRYDQPSCFGYDVAANWSIIVHVPDDERLEANELEVIHISGWLSSGLLDYSERTDTLTFGHKRETATVVAENRDLIVYWAPPKYDPDGLEPIAVDLHNASKHLAPVLAATSAKLVAKPD